MTDEQKTTQEEPRAPFEGIPFAAMMRKMMGQQGSGCDCATQSMMSQMMAMCGGAQTEEEKTTTETTQNNPESIRRDKND
ncbi:MAG: hypothetical protein ACE5FZ_09955 [Nitrospiria bacterium]